MTIEQIAEITDISKKIEAYKSGKTATPVESYKKQYDVSGHSIMNKSVRPDKQIKKTRPSETDPTKQVSYTERIEPVGRIALALQQIIVGRAVAFLFGFEPKIKGNTQNNTIADSLVMAVKAVLNLSKSNSLNRAVARDLFRCTEVAEYWYQDEVESANLYGFESKLKLRSAIFSPWKGDLLFPLFDKFGDMVAFSRQYETSDETIFEVYSKNSTEIYSQSKGAASNPWELTGSTPHNLGKIPIVYAQQENVEWQSVTTAIERLENLLSNFADTNDYNGSPILFVKGTDIKLPNKNESGKVLRGSDEKSDVKFVSWQHAPESIKLEIETLFNIVYSFTQTPNISFESVQKIGAISGIALKLLFMDAHLKVMDKREIFDSYLIRRLNIIKAFLVKMNPQFKEVENTYINAEITPYITGDLKELIDTLNVATGGLPLLSQKTAIEYTGITDSVADELAQIQAEQTQLATASTFPPFE